MKRSVFETILGAVVLAVAALFLFMAYQKSDMGRPTAGYRVYASFSSADGLKTGADVRVAGVKVGSVDKLKLDAANYQALAVLQLNNGVKVPTDSVAQIASDGLLGGKYVNLQIGGDEKTIAPDGKFEYTAAAANLEALLGQAIFSKNNSGDNSNSGAGAAPAPAAAPAPLAAPVAAPTAATPAAQ